MKSLTKPGGVVAVVAADRPVRACKTKEEEDEGVKPRLVRPATSSSDFSALKGGRQSYKESEKPFLQPPDGALALRLALPSK